MPGRTGSAPTRAPRTPAIPTRRGTTARAATTTVRPGRVPNAPGDEPAEFQRTDLDPGPRAESRSSTTEASEERFMSETKVQMCIFPGCDRPAVPGHDLGGPQPHFCEDEAHNAGSAHNA